MKSIKFTHKEFLATSWEGKLKEFIESIDYSDNIIWHRKRENKKINEELSTLGYYVKYKFGQDETISFKLNEKEGKADGWIYENGKEIKSIQIAIAYYEKKEAEIDRKIMNGEDVVEGGWVGDRISLLKERVEKRVNKKSNMAYVDIDTLLIGVRDWFVRRINSEYSQQKADILSYINLALNDSNFKHAAIVDTDFVGAGGLLVVHNNVLHAERATASHL